MLGTALTATVLSLPPLFLIKYLDYKTKNITKVLQQTTEQDQFKFMFVTNKNRLCSPHLGTRLICGTTCSYLYLKNIISLINQAKVSVSVCMYHLSVDAIYHAILNAHHRGVIVRIISDLVMLASTGNRITKLSKSVPAKTPKVKFGLMHHKYLLIDEKTTDGRKVLFGSLNYTINAFINNWEYVVLTSSADIVKQFSDEFDFLWQNDNFAFVGIHSHEIVASPNC